MNSDNFKNDILNLCFTDSEVVEMHLDSVKLIMELQKRIARLELLAELEFQKCNICRQKINVEKDELVHWLLKNGLDQNVIDSFADRN